MAKKAAVKPRPAARVKPKTKPSPPSVAGVAATVRMYAQGLGDCFLLTFPGATGSKPARVLIDCGVFQGTPGESDRLRQVALEIKEETGGEIDLLIVTHEHWDHVAGFSRAFDLFEGITFGAVWLSWAEDGDDPAARALKADLGRSRDRVRAALTHFKTAGVALGAKAVQDMRTAEALLDFFGPNQPAGLAGGGGPRVGMSLGETMDWLRSKVRPGDFRKPGQRRNLPGAPGVKVYVLGPPSDPQAIRKMDPTGDQGYGLRSERVSLAAAIGAMVAGDTSPAGPFDGRHRVNPEDARLDPFFREVYGFADDPMGDAGSAWRRIDDEWLGGLSRLALQLDTGVNNTSLALAFELPDGRTLIFPGDAQIGNWLSWDDVTFRDEEERALAVTAKGLLNRAVFYKVGHHGSHNATRKAGGLEEMTGGGLVAMVPTDEAFAKTKRPPESGWKMPFDALNRALDTATGHRILRPDRTEAELDQAAGDDAGTARWKQFRGRVRFATETLVGTDRKLYVEYDVPG